MIRFKVVCLFIAVLCLGSAPAFADTVFADGTFNSADYTSTALFTSDSSVSLTAGQCASCGNPGNGLQLVGASNGTVAASGVGTAEILFVNTTFSYDPSTQGAINSISASVDKDLTSSYAGSSSSVIGNTFRPLIEQDGIYYLAAISGPGISSGMTTGYNTIAQSGLVAADFVEFDPATDTFLTGIPNFDGDTMLFGLGQVFGLPEAPGSPSSLTADYDNLNLAISAPEPSTLLLAALGLLGLFVVSRKRWAARVTA
jgi:PEP-CTERM motif